MIFLGFAFLALATTINMISELSAAQNVQVNYTAKIRNSEHWKLFGDVKRRSSTNIRQMTTVRTYWVVYGSNERQGKPYSRIDFCELFIDRSDIYY